MANLSQPPDLVHFALAASNFAGALAREGERDVFSSGKIGNRAEELLTIMRGDDRRFVRRLNRVRIAETADALGTHRVNDII